MTCLASFPKNSREEVQISLDEFNGHSLINMRVWFQAADGEMRPSRQGLSIRVEQFPELMEALRAVEQAIPEPSVVNLRPETEHENTPSPQTG